MAKVRNIYLDMDQVLSDWISGVGKLYGAPRLYWEWTERSKLNGGSDRLEDLLHFPLVEIKEKINAAGVEFWADLIILPWAKDLYDRLLKIGPVTIISSAGNYKYAKEGKATWLRKNLGHSGPVIFCGPGEKYQYVGDGILIDDLEKTIKQVKNARLGGVGILFPSPCNSWGGVPADSFLSGVIDSVVLTAGGGGYCHWLVNTLGLEAECGDFELLYLSESFIDNCIMDVKSGLPVQCPKCKKEIKLEK